MTDAELTPLGATEATESPELTIRVGLMAPSLLTATC